MLFLARRLYSLSAHLVELGDLPAKDGISVDFFGVEEGELIG